MNLINCILYRHSPLPAHFSRHPARTRATRPLALLRLRPTEPVPMHTKFNSVVVAKFQSTDTHSLSRSLAGHRVAHPRELIDHQAVCINKCFAANASNYYLKQMVKRGQKDNNF